VKVSYDEGLANRIGLESCVTMHREVRHEALTEVQAGQPSSRESYIQDAETVQCVEGNMGERDIASAHSILRGQRTWHVCKLLEQELGDLWVGRDYYDHGPYREDRRGQRR
jgi:hypothetical protein